MGIDDFFEHIDDFSIDELADIIHKIQYKTSQKLCDLPNYNTVCCMSDDSEATQEEFEECEAKQTVMLLPENDVMTPRCVVCGGTCWEIMREE